MGNVASWIREVDDRYFRRFFEKREGMNLFDARVGPVDMSKMDGLLLTGGEDIGADFLKQEIPDPSVLEPPVPERDKWEFEAVRIALQEGKPVFAVCKGHQVLNVALGGTLYLDIQGHNQPEDRMENTMPMRYSASAKHRIPLVNSSHHQSVDRPGEGLEVEGWCDTDDVIEQMTLRNYPFCLSVQYHPERDWIYESLFQDFFDHILKK